MMLTFLFATVGWVIFRAESIDAAWNFLKGIVTQGLLQAPMITHPRDLMIVLLSIVLLFVVEWVNRNASHEFALQPRNRVVRWMGYLLLLFLIGAFMQTNEMPFIYFQF